MSTISVRTTNEEIADYAYLRKRIIKDKERHAKRGVSDYWIESYLWYGERQYVAVIDACWFTETTVNFLNLRDASNWIKEKIYNIKP